LDALADHLGRDSPSLDSACGEIEREGRPHLAELAVADDLVRGAEPLEVGEKLDYGEGRDEYLRAPLGLPSGRVTVGRGLWIVLASSLLLWRR